MILIFAFSTEDEQEKFEYIFHKYRRLMLHKAYSVLQDYMLAEDAASEGLIRIYKNLHKIDDLDSPSTAAFIVTIVKNVALTMTKRNENYNTVLFPTEEVDTFHLEEQVLGQISSEDIYHLIDEMGEELKGVFLLKFAYDMSHREIAGALGISENNVTVRLHRGKKRLSELLRKEGYLDESTR